jgi:hypothetical protein
MSDCSMREVDKSYTCGGCAFNDDCRKNDDYDDLNFPCGNFIWRDA